MALGRALWGGDLCELSHRRGVGTFVAAPATFCRLFCSIRNEFIGAWGGTDLSAEGAVR